ncbi:MAG: tetratricopeptide repeat-containing serine protease family protein [candidate division Zixibacteria bacterium]|nr:tetratricopeptide repeat-containing serine protease family protein [candidate division Zixibacteria bacterium]
MKIRPIFLVPWLVYIFFIVGFSPAWSQENLPTLIKKVQQSVVVIITYNEKGEILGQGTGFFISTEGDVITNIHVLGGAHRADVKTAEGIIYPVKNILAEDREADLIRVSVDISHKDVHPLPVGASMPEVGEQVVVIGNPLGLEQTASDGIVSAVREIPNFGKIIQITAPVSLGSSGSPVLNIKGEVIGVATFQIIEGQNLNFVIPGDRVTKLKPEKGVALTEWKEKRIEEWLTSPEVLYYTGLRFLLSGEYKEALPYLEKAVEKDPNYVNAYSYIGYCNLSFGRYQEAIEACKQAIRIKPDDFDSHYNLGMAFYALGRYQEAIEAFKEAIRIKPDDAEPYGNLGVAYVNLGRYQEAIEALKQVIRIKPDDALAHYDLGVAYVNLGRYQEAIEAYRQAIRIKPAFCRGIRQSWSRLW